MESGGKFEITLDQKKLKTPKGNIFAVESEPLALAVATEWNSQKDKIIQSKMHIVRYILQLNRTNYITMKGFSFFSSYRQHYAIQFLTIQII